MAHTPYVNFEFYLSEYMGKLIEDNAEWLTCARAADAYMDSQTMRRLRLVQEGEIPREAAFAICAICEVLFRHELDEKKRPCARVRSAGTTDGYSETFVSAADVHKNLQTELRSALDLYLPRDNPLRFRGI